MSKEVKVFVNTRLYKIFSVKNDQNYIEICAHESLEVCCPESLNKPVRMKKFTADIKYNDGYFANIYSNELVFDEDGEIRYKPVLS